MFCNTPCNYGQDKFLEEVIGRLTPWLFECQHPSTKSATICTHIPTPIQTLPLTHFLTQMIIVNNGFSFNNAIQPSEISKTDKRFRKSWFIKRLARASLAGIDLLHKDSTDHDYRDVNGILPGEGTVDLLCDGVGLETAHGCVGYMCRGLGWCVGNKKEGMQALENRSWGAQRCVERRS